MRIWHIGSARSPYAVSAVNSVVWTLAAAQAQAGHDVLVIVGDRPDHTAACTARRMGVNLLHIPCSRWRFHPVVLADRLRDERPDVVHFHSVLVPRQATLARTLLKWQIPYVITPHGRLAPQVLARKSFRKSIYSTLVERTRFSRSSAITYSGPGEQDQINDYLSYYPNQMHWIPNPVNLAAAENTQWQPTAGSRKLVFLGRFDVAGKGIDLLLKIAEKVADAEFHLYGEPMPGSEHALNDLKRTMSQNVFFHAPVYGEEKAKVLADAAMYVQMSRWDGFPLSVAEAMSLGVPCAINENLEISPLFREKNLGLLLPTDPKAAAIKIRWALEHSERLKEWSVQGRAYAQAKLRPEKVAEEYERVYRKALPMRSPSIVIELLSLAATAVGVFSSPGLAD